MAGRTFGVDISRWDGIVDMSRLMSAGVDFVIAKCGGGDDGLYEDSKWQLNYKSCKSVGMPIGAYYYSAATTVSEARDEAAHCIGLLRGKRLEYPVWYDVEDGGMTSLPSDELKDVIEAFCSELEQAGYYVGIYSWAWLIESADVPQYDRWVAAWTRSCTMSDPDMWQFGGEQNVIRSTGVAGYDPIDQSYCYRDYPSIMVRYGFNGYSAGDDIDVPEDDEPTTSGCYETVVFKTEVNVRDAPSTATGRVVSLYETGESCIIDGMLDGDGYIWGTYIGGSGKRRYAALGTHELARFVEVDP